MTTVETTTQTTLPTMPPDAFAWLIQGKQFAAFCIPSGVWIRHRWSRRRQRRELDPVTKAPRVLRWTEYGETLRLISDMPTETDSALGKFCHEVRDMIAEAKCLRVNP